MMYSLHCRVLGAALAVLSGVGPVSAVEIIVNPGVTMSEVSRPLARLIFGAKVTRWEDGSAIRVFVLPDESPLHQEMSKGILNMYPYQLRMAWDRIIYTGIGLAPIQVANESEMRKQVAAVPGAIGYVGGGLNNDKVRTLSVR
jgi:ABC-type phosphate transport system substrate-binding protein